jgi:formylmethanofuran dehydrogenase subunit D
VTYVDKPSVLTHYKLGLELNTGTDIYQGACKKRGSTLKDEYRKVAGVAYMDPEDMSSLNVANWDSVLVKSDWGEVVVYGVLSRDAPHEGQIFIPKGPWANVVVSNETYCCSDPTYKGIRVTVEKSDKEVLLMRDLMREVYQKYVKKAEEAD